MLQLWTKQNLDDGDHHDSEGGVRWLHSELANLGSERVDIFFFAESRGFLLVEQGGAFFIVDLKSKEKVRVNLKRDGTHWGMRWFPTNYCSSSFCDGHQFGRICSETPPVLYEMVWVYSCRMVLTSSTDDTMVD